MLLMVCFLAQASLFAQTLNIYVSPTGANTGQGANTSNPVSFSRARTIAKATANKVKTCHIWLMDGVYTTLALDTTDSRSATAPVTYHSLNRLKASFQPITPINVADLVSVPDSIKKRIIDTVAQSKVRQVDLSKYNLSNMSAWPNLFGYPINVSATGSTRQNWPLLYQNTTPLPMAQYPKGDSVMRMKSVLNNGGTGTGGSAGIFKYRDGRCQYWGQAIQEGLWLRGCWRVPWQMDFVKTDSINLKDSIVYQSVGVSGGIGNKYTRPAGNGQEPYIAVNLVEEISLPGEWAINFNTNMLYVYPPDTGVLNISSNSATPNISLSKVHYTNFEGISLDGGSGIGIKLSGCSYVSIAGMDIKHVSSYGILIADGNNCTVRSNDIHEVGEGGVYVISSTFNADQLLLKACNHTIINNHIYNYAEQVFLYAAAIDTRNAIGCYAAYNNIHGCKHVGVLFGGNNNVYEYNDVSNVVTTYNDMGAFYSAEIQTKRGNKIQRNYIHAMNYCGSALYADNNSQGNIFNGNIAANCLFGVQNNFGLFNNFNNNIYFDNYKYQCSYEIAMTDTVSTSTAYKRVKTVDSTSAIYKAAYPELKDYFDTVNKAYTSAVWPQINGNVFIGTSVNLGRCISPVVDKSLFLTNGKTSTTYAQTGAPFTQYGLICNNNFFAKTSSFKGVNTNLLDSVKSTGVFSKTAVTDWHIDRIGLFKDSIYRSDIFQTQTQGVSPSFNLQVQSLHAFTLPDTLTITTTIKNPNINKCYSTVLLFDSGKAKPSIPFTVTKSTFDSIVLSAKWINPAVGNHVIAVHLLDSTRWEFSSDTSSIAIQAALPLKLLHFNAVANGCNAQLSWKVAEEVGVIAYHIESADKDGQFKLVKTLYPNNKGVTESYKANIPQISDATSYRVHIITHTNNWYSPVALVKTNCLEKEQLSIVPNPIYAGSLSEVKLRYFSNENNTTLLSVFDAAGKLVVTKSVIIQSGNNEYIFPVTTLKKGVYFIKLSHSGVSAKFIVW